jgi:TetR/AcrR family transcriptional regulator, repressor for uid operon
MQIRSEETRARILAAALKCFARSGYQAAGVAEICAEAGVSKGALYHHFKTKQEIFLTLLYGWLDEIDAGLLRTRQSGEPVDQALIHMAEHIQGIFQDADGRLPMFIEFWAQAIHDPAVWQATIEPYRRYQRYFADMLREGIAEGSLRELDPDAAARTLVSLAVGLLLQGVLDPQGTAWGVLPGQSVRYLIEGLARRNP